MNDKDLRQMIIDELDFDPSIDAAKVGVAVDDGIVTLTGHVGSYAEKICVERAVQRLKGVRAIAEEIEVRFADSDKVDDEDIAKRCLDVIAWNAVVPTEAVKVKVQDAWVTLTGRVDWDFQRKAAESSVRKLSSIVGLTNLVEVRNEVKATDVKKAIEEALKRNAELEANQIRVIVDNNNVTLEGTVHAWGERYAAERAAWSAPGVRAVQDHLKVA